ncbi:hypothetical protein ROU88_08360 [Macrococcus capreoli]
MDKVEYQQIIEMIKKQANTVLFTVPDYVIFEDEEFYKKFKSQLMSTTNTDNWVGDKKPKIEMTYRYYLDDKVIKHFEKCDHFFQKEEYYKTPLAELHTDITFLKFNEVIVEVIGHEEEVYKEG